MMAKILNFVADNFTNKFKRCLFSTNYKKSSIIHSVTQPKIVDADRPYFQVIDAVSGVDITPSVIIKGSDSNETDAQSASFFISRLTGGRTIRLQGKLDLSNPSSNQVLF